MVICTVVGHVWATKKKEQLEGLKLMVVQEEHAGAVHVAADVVGAGIGERVLAVSGSTVRKVLGSDDVPADMAIVGIIDNLEIDRSLRQRDRR